MTAPYPQQPVAGRDRSTMWGILGIVIGLLCCGIVGIIFGYLSIRDAQRFGKSPVLGWLAIGLSVFNIVLNGIWTVKGNHPWVR
ncbi:MAG TPA: hypothetical protein VFX61_03510 [Micromonosporaceae bacterium]|nr:hypothetical protein [Micromonosporaceae bacterium]